MHPNNIINCQKCRAPLIAEEIGVHECFTGTMVNTTYDTGTDEYHLFDGKRWYRWFPELNEPTKSQQPNKTTRDSTEQHLLTTC